jgi:hypothetical protein
MNLIFKRLIIAILVITVSGVIGSLIYFKSDYYLNKQASQKMHERLAFLNALKRRYIHEGVYIYRCNLVNQSYITDKYGNERVISEDKGYIDYEIAFTSKKLVILNKNKSIKEEIIFKNKYIITNISEDMCSYGFSVDKWYLRNSKNNELIEDILLKNKYDDKLIILFVEKNKFPRFHGFYEFQSVSKGISYAKSTSFLGLGLSDKVNDLPLDSLVYKYDNTFTPDYVNKARYEDYEYEIDSYRKRSN